MFWEIWSSASGNLVAQHDTEAEVLAFVRTALVEYGRDIVAAWSLAEEPGDQPAVFGDELIARALASAPVTPAHAER